MGSSARKDHTKVFARGDSVDVLVALERVDCAHAEHIEGGRSDADGCDETDGIKTYEGAVADESLGSHSDYRSSGLGYHQFVEARECRLGTSISGRDEFGDTLNERLDLVVCRLA